MNQEQVKRLLIDLFADDHVANSPSCHGNQDDIVAYVAAELDGLNAAALDPGLHTQLQSCASCRIVYEELKDLLTLEQAGMLAEPPIAAEFDLSFLAQGVVAGHRTGALPSASNAWVTSQRKPESILWTLNELGQMIVSLSAEFIAALQPSPQPTYLKAPARDLFEVTSPAIADDLTVTLSARETRRNPAQCIITVTATIPSRGGWPNLGGIAVTLSIGEDDGETRVTDTFGKVVFAEIARADLSRLRVVVKPAA